MQNAIASHPEPGRGNAISVSPFHHKGCCACWGKQKEKTPTMLSWFDGMKKEKTDMATVIVWCCRCSCWIVIAVMCHPSLPLIYWQSKNLKTWDRDGPTREWMIGI